METRIEIFRGGLWRELKLKDKTSIKYNAVINRIGKLDVREISHTNTFSIPIISQNINVLGINFFSPSALAVTLNSKFEAKYYVEDKLLQSGFLIINNTRDGNINVNFIDEALSIIDIWGSTSYRSLLTSESSSIPSDYQTAIAAMTGYSMTKVAVLAFLPPVGARGYNLAYFPNNLNVVGDEFQLDNTGVRVDDAFNPYQSRPIFNVKALFDLACEAYGYTSDFTNIDLDILKSECMVSAKLGEGVTADSALQTHNYYQVSSINYYSVIESGTNDYYRFAYEYGSDAETLRPSDITGWPTPPNFAGGYENQYCILVPKINNSISGLITYTSTITRSVSSTPNPRVHDVYAAWEDTSLPPNNWLFQALTPINDNSTSTTIDFQIDKFELSSSKPANAGELLGLIYQERFSCSSGLVTLVNVNTSEEYVPDDSGVVFDEYKQFGNDTVDLTYAASEKNIKTLLSSYMQKEAILMQINSKTKVIKFFTYGYYETQKENGVYMDWSQYLRKYSSFYYNTDYGKNYYKKNRIGLSEPYSGNSYSLEINNQGVENKLKDSGDNLVKNFKDIENIVSVNNTTTPYFEYKNTGLGLVSIGTPLGTLSQQRADGTVQGNTTGVAAALNVNYSSLPIGVREWYTLVDRAIKVEAKFLLPVSEIKELDLSKPVFVEGLGGFFIVEEIAEYVNAQTTVNVKLIKLVDNLKA